MRILSIDILRGLAALGVTWFHLTGSSGLSKKTADMGEYGDLGVIVFFIISGFVLPLSLLKSAYSLKHYPVFILKRLVRIDPPYIVAILVGLFWTIIVGTSLPGFRVIASHFGYVTALLGFNWISPVFWTLAIEFQFYLVLGLMYNFLMVKNEVQFTGCLLLILACSFFFDDVRLLTEWFALFALGILLFRARFFNSSIWLLVGTLVVCLSVVYLKHGLTELVAACSTVVFVLFFNFKDESSFLIKPFLKLGTISYSLYLIHWDVGRVFVAISRHVPLLGNVEIIRVFIGLIASIIFSRLFFIVLEKPAILLSSKIKYESS